MFGMFKKKLKTDAKVAVFADDTSISIARIRQEQDLPPSLDLCDMHEIENISIRDAELARLARMHHLDQYTCYSALELGDYNLLLVEAPDVEPDEVRAAIRFRIKDLIDFDLNDAIVDVFEAPAGKSAGASKMMYAVVARADRVKGLISSFKDVGLSLDIIDIPELALRNVASRLPEDVAGVALVYVGRQQGLITITRNSELYLSRTINVGYDSLPDEPVNAQTDERCQRWLDSIVIEVQRSMDYYESHFSQPQVSAIVMTPVDKEIQNMPDYISEQLQIPARTLDVNALIDVMEPISRNVQSHCLLAIGAALREEAA